MKQNEAFPSNYVKADDVLDNETEVTIKAVLPEEMENRSGEKEVKPVVVFSDYEKKFVLNKTNWNRIETLTGEDDSDSWVGHKIILTTEMVDAFGEIKPAVRVKMLTGKEKDITAYWTRSRELGYTQKDGQQFLAKHGNNFVAALNALNNPEPV